MHKLGHGDEKNLRPEDGLLIQSYMNQQYTSQRRRHHTKWKSRNLRELSPNLCRKCLMQRSMKFTN